MFLFIIIFSFLFCGCSFSGYSTMKIPIDTDSTHTSDKVMKECYYAKGKLDFYTAEAIIECVNNKGEELHYEEHHTDLGMASSFANEFEKLIP